MKTKKPNKLVIDSGKHAVWQIDASVCILYYAPANALRSASAKGQVEAASQQIERNLAQCTSL